jgi:hypothetical protein
VLLHVLTGFGWRQWYLDVGMGLVTVAVCFVWIRQRQSKLFRTDIRPMLEWQLRHHQIDRYAALGAMRQHSELRTLLDEVSRWVD